VQKISPPAALPTITDPVIIDGYTQSFMGVSASPNTQDIGDNAVLLIQVDGAMAGGFTRRSMC